MFSNNLGLSPADAIALSGNDNGFGGNGSWFWLIILIVLFGWGGNGFGYGGGRGGVQQDYVLTSDIATIERKLDEQNNGICNLGYTQAQLINGVNTNVSNVGFGIQNAITQDTIANMQNTNALSAQLASCCCENKAQLADLKYTMATESCATRQAIADGTKAIIDKITADRLSQLEQENSALRLSQSQTCQNAYLINALRPSPTPAYVVPNPFGCNCNNYGYGFYNGTTIA